MRVTWSLKNTSDQHIISKYINSETVRHTCQRSTTAFFIDSKVDASKVAITRGVLEGREKVSKIVYFGVSRELVPGAILQNLATQSIFGFRCSFFVEIEAEIKEISHRKWISKSGVFPGSAFDIKKR